MILGRDNHPAAECFRELDDALVALGRPDVVLNAHTFPSEVPAGAIVYNLEHVPLQVSPYAFGRAEAVWDYSERNVKAWRGVQLHGRKVVHVPIGYHPSMERFRMRPWDSRDVDVMMCGTLTQRRADLLNALLDAGLNVVHLAPGSHYGAERDAMLARSKLVLNVLVGTSRNHPVLRSAHLVANRVPMLAEWAPETPRWVMHGCPYDSIVQRCKDMVRQSVRLTDIAEEMYRAFRESPMTVPS